MTFKVDWEKPSQQYDLPEIILTSMVQQAFPKQSLEAYKLIPGGCANLNIHIKLTSHADSYILRVYLREPNAAYREQQLAKFLQAHLPLPQIYHIGELADYRFAISQFISGITLRDLLLGNERYNLSELMFAAGQYLGKIQKHRFASSGFFDQELKIVQTISNADYVEFAKDCLEQLSATESLKPELIQKIHKLVEEFSFYFPTEKDDHLVHADFDPANILVEKHQDVWKISGILDWEFSYSGSPLCDVANMLRYAHHMPDTFTLSFLAGFKEDYLLPDDWRPRTHIMNLLALLDCLALSPIEKKPKRFADICTLIEYIVRELENARK
jgi:aminoglycoside phosphotransferase (APT) family kinase protein